MKQLAPKRGSPHISPPRRDRFAEKDPEFRKFMLLLCAHLETRNGLKAELARHLGASRSLVSHWTSGNGSHSMSSDNLFKIILWMNEQRNGEQRWKWLLRNRRVGRLLKCKFAK